ncbi:hypothetical protein [Patulibacter minatonensis]|uniref:hypothetical protein n=1 Tax=Patulibacter minatonensis TaxID=298163 RepID=UPI00047CDEBC|nr:hypothetical protein [Patulibacter minatonensis]
MRASVPAAHPRRTALGAAALAVTSGLALVPTAGADVLVSRSDDARGTARPVLVTPDGTRRELAAAPIDGLGHAPVVSPDRSVVAVVGPATVDGLDGVTLLPTDGSPARPLAGATTSIASSGSEFWWTDGPPRLISAITGLGVRGEVDTCAVPARTCKETKAPGETLIGSFDTGASLWTRSGTFLLPETLGSAYQRWTTATAAQVRRVRAGLRRRLVQRVVLRSSDGKERILSTARRAPGTGVLDYERLTDRGPAIVTDRVTHRTTMRTRTRKGRLQLRLTEELRGSVTRAYSPSGRSSAFRLRVPAGTTGAVGEAPTPVAGGWLIAVRAKDVPATRRLARLAPDGTTRTITLGGSPLTVTSLSAALGLPKPEAGPRRGDISGLRPVGYEAATDSDVVMFDVPADSHQVIARIPRSGAAPSLVLTGAPHQRVGAIAW